MVKQRQFACCLGTAPPLPPSLPPTPPACLRLLQPASLFPSRPSRFSEVSKARPGEASRGEAAAAAVAVRDHLSLPRLSEQRWGWWWWSRRRRRRREGVLTKHCRLVEANALGQMWAKKKIKIQPTAPRRVYFLFFFTHGKILHCCRRCCYRLC